MTNEKLRLACFFSLRCIHIAAPGSLCSISTELRKERGVSGFLYVRSCFDLAEHSEMRTEPTQHLAL